MCYTFSSSLLVLSLFLLAFFACISLFFSLNILLIPCLCLPCFVSSAHTMTRNIILPLKVQFDGMLLNSFSFHFVVLRILMVNWPSGVVEFSNLFLWEEMEYLAIVVAWSTPSFKISARAECLLSFLCLPFPFYSKAFVHRFTFPTWLSCYCINYHINLVAVHV